MAVIDWRRLFSNLGSFPWLPWTLAIVVLILCTAGVVELMPWKVLVDVLKAPSSLSREVWVWVTASLLCFAVANAIYYLAQSLIPQKTPNVSTVFSVFWAIAVSILILLLIFSLPDVVKPGYGVLAAIAGGVVGGWSACTLVRRTRRNNRSLPKSGLPSLPCFPAIH